MLYLRGTHSRPLAMSKCKPITKPRRTQHWLMRLLIIEWHNFHHVVTFFRPPFNIPLWQILALDYIFKLIAINSAMLPLPEHRFVQFHFISNLIFVLPIVCSATDACIVFFFFLLLIFSHSLIRSVVRCSRLSVQVISPFFSICHLPCHTFSYTNRKRSFKSV